MRRTSLLVVGIVFLGSLVAEPIKENIGLYGGQVSDIEALNIAGSSEILIAVDSSQRGVYRWNASAARWGSVTNPDDSSISGHIPGSANLVEGNPNSSTDVYATLTLNSSGMFSRLHVSDNYGDLDPNVSWVEAVDTTGSEISEVTALVGHASGMYAGTRDGVILLNTGTSTDPFSAVFTHPSGHEIVSFTVASATLGYVITSSSGILNLHSTDWGGTDTNLTANLPAAAPIELRTGSCPLTSCPLEINLIGADPVKTDGKTIFIAGSSTNGQAFKSTDGGVSWNNGWDYQCGVPASGCSGYGFTDGFPQEIRFRGTATSGTESRNVFISRVVMDQDDASPSWSVIPSLQSSIQPSGPSGPTIIISTNANDGALAIDPNDSTVLYIATDLAMGEVEHTVASGYANPSGFEKGNALGIDGLVVNGLDYFENSSTDKELYVVAKSGVAFAKGYDPTDPTSVSTRDGWVFPIYPMGDGAPPTAVKFDPNDKKLVLVGNGKIYRNPTADGSVSITDVATNWTRVFDPNDSAFSGSGTPLESDRVERSYTTGIDWETAGGVCDRVYMTVANTDTGTEGGVFYSDDKGLTWTADTLASGGLLKMPVNAISGVSQSSIFPIIGVGDLDGRSSETGIYRRVSYCLSQDWSKPTHSSDTVFDEIQTKPILAIDALSARPSSSSVDAIMFIVAHDAVYRGQLNSSSVTTETGWNKWDFSDVTPSGGMGFADVAMEPDDTDHVWVAYDNCIKESTDGGLTWSDFSNSCQPDHEVVKILVYDDLIAGSSGGAYAYMEISLSSSTIEENSVGATVGTLTPNSDTYTYSLSGDDAASFVVAGAELSLAESVSADFEIQSSYTMTATATDSTGNSTSKELTIDVVDVNESPTDVALSASTVEEDIAGAQIGTLSANDPDANDTLTFSLSGDDADSFEVSQATLKLLDSVSADYGTQSSYAITVVATDSANNTAQADFTISVTESSSTPIVEPPVTDESDGGGCFIATAAFGSYENRYVKSLRSFRDTHLLTNNLGAEFVDLYYQYSPPLAAKIESNEFLKSAARVAIYPMVGFASIVDMAGWSGVFVLILALFVGFGIFLLLPARRRIIT